MKSHQDDNINQVAELAHTSVEDCYQCGKCTAGCPMAEAMDLGPSQIMRLVQLGQVDRAAKAESPWLCVSCMTCTTRCPQEVEIAGIMDAVKQIAIERGLVADSQMRTLVFQRAFLDNIRKYGRLHELGLVQMFKMAAFMNDYSVIKAMEGAMLGPKMLMKGKLHLAATKVKDRGVVKRIFERCMKNGK